jgi:hypothetical protein
VFSEGGGKILKKSLLLLASVALTVGGVRASAQEKIAYSPDEMKVLGVLDNGQSSKLVEFTSTPKYRAFVFEGNGRDRVEITVTGANQKAYVALADSSLIPIASGLGRLVVSLPYHGPDTESFYILVKNLANQPARLTVHLEKTTGPGHAPDATR